MQNLPVHWHEGMFLRPQHFQAADRFWSDSLATSEHWDHEYNYGLRAIQFSAEAIANNQFQLSECHARLKDGTLVVLNPGRELDRVDLRNSLADGAVHKVDLTQAFEGASTVRVYLAVPKLKLGSANASAAGEPGNHRFATESQAVPDDCGSSQDQEIELRNLNVRLLLSTQELTGFEVVPIAQIQRAGTENAAPQLDLGYIPPVLAIDAWVQLGRDIFRAIYDIVSQKVEVLSRQLSGRAIGLATQDPADAQRLWMLHVLNPALTTLRVLAFARGVHPLQAYTELCRLVGQLSIFSDSRTPPEIPAYDHDDLGTIFSYIKLQIELLLSKVRDFEYEQRFFVGEGMGMQVALDPKWLNANWTWYVGVFRGGLTEAACRSLPGEINWKLGSADQVDSIFKERMRGLDLTPVDQLPRALPALRDCTFFSVVRQGPAWDQVARSSTLAMRFTAELIRNRDRLQGSRDLLLSIKNKTYSLQIALFAVPRTTP